MNARAALARCRCFAVPGLLAFGVASIDQETGKRRPRRVRRAEPRRRFPIKQALESQMVPSGAERLYPFPHGPRLGDGQSNSLLPGEFRYVQPSKKRDDALGRFNLVVRGVACVRHNAITEHRSDSSGQLPLSATMPDRARRSCRQCCDQFDKAAAHRDLSEPSCICSAAASRHPVCMSAMSPSAGAKSSARPSTASPATVSASSPGP